MRLIPSILLLTISFYSTATLTQTRIWNFTDKVNISSRSQATPSQFKTLGLQFHLLSLPKSAGIKTNIEIPDPDGAFETFSIVSTPAFSDGLAAKYPKFGSYTGRSYDGKKILHMSYSPYGIHAMVTKDNGAIYYIDPLNVDSNSEYIVYYRHHLTRKIPFTCMTRSLDPEDPLYEINHRSLVEKQKIAGDCKLRSYKLALACTGEYARFHGGSKEKVLAAYNTTMTRVNGIYERDLGIKMVLIDDTDKLIFLDPFSDPYTNGSALSMLNQNRNTCNNIIGFNNYDIGHVFSTGGGGLAMINGPCNSQKAEGVTGSSSPAGDPFDIDYVAHEMGHQFGANHSFNNACDGNRNESTAFEPGSGSTIMGYAGICPPNIAQNSDAYFHAISIREINDFVTSSDGGNKCAKIIEINNTAPTIQVNKNIYNIPAKTSFFLEVHAQDPEQDNLTYCWEQMDNEIATMPPKSSSTAGPLFRSIPPKESPRRYFPDLGRIYGQWEVLPTVARKMNFRCTVRDNHIGKGCTSEVDVQVSSVSNSQFEVIQPNTSDISWLVGSNQTITWKNNGTNEPPINTNFVDIYLSTDGGKSYPHLLLGQTANDGQEEILVPSLPSDKARIMIVGHENIFFDVSNDNFKITSTFTFNANTDKVNLCNEDSININLTLEKQTSTDQTITLSIENLPANCTASFSNTSVILPGQSVLTISGLRNLELGSTIFNVKAATTGTEALYEKITINKFSFTPQKANLLSPSNGAQDIPSTSINLSWEPIIGMEKYQVQVSAQPNFSNLIVDQMVTKNNLITNLEKGKIYFWRVKSISPCISNEYSNTFTFRTNGFNTQSAIITKNELLVVDQGAAGVIDTSLLSFISPKDSAFIIILDNVKYGSLMLDGQTLSVGSVITYKSIIEGKVTYMHNDLGQFSDQFKFILLDELGRWLPNQLFNIRVKSSELNGAVQKIQPIKCFGVNDGIIKVIAYGGIPPYTYSIDDGNTYVNDSIFSNLSSGMYKVKIKDDTNTEFQLEGIELSGPSKIELTKSTSNYDIIASAVGGTGDLIYSIDGINFQENGLFVDPGNGTFYISVKDEYNCIVTDSITLDISPLMLAYEILNPINCFGEKSNVIATPTGGIPPYSYAVNNGSFGSSNMLAISAGTNIIRVKDAGNKIVVSDTIKTNTPSQIILSPKFKKLTLTARVSGGTPPYKYSDDGLNYKTDSVFMLQSNGTFKLYVKDDLGCSRTFTLNVSVLLSTREDIRHLKCYNTSDGYLRLTPEGGASPFRYSLDGEQLQSNREWSNLSAGVHTYLIVDNRNDSLSGTVFINRPDSLVVVVEQVANSLMLVGSGGTPPYVYSIDGQVFINGNTFNDLPYGEYFPTIKDKNGCLTNHNSIVIGAIDDTQQNDWTIFPNPAQTRITIESKRSSLNYRMEIYDFTGKKVLRHDDISVSQTMDISNLLSGLYLVKISNGNKTYLRSFIKI